MQDGNEEQMLAALQNILNECRQINQALHELVKLQQTQQSHLSQPRRARQWASNRHIGREKQMAFDRYSRPSKGPYGGAYRGPRGAGFDRERSAGEDTGGTGPSNRGSKHPTSRRGVNLENP